MGFIHVKILKRHYKLILRRVSEVVTHIVGSGLWVLPSVVIMQINGEAQRPRPTLL